MQSTYRKLFTAFAAIAIMLGLTACHGDDTDHMRSSDNVPVAKPKTQPAVKLLPTGGNNHPGVVMRQTKFYGNKDITFRNYECRKGFRTLKLNFLGVTKYGDDLRIKMDIGDGKPHDQDFVLIFDGRLGDFPHKAVSLIFNTNANEYRGKKIVDNYVADLTPDMFRKRRMAYDFNDFGAKFNTSSLSFCVRP